MRPIKAFVAHSFSADDKVVVSKFLEYFNEINNTHPSFSWQHAERAQSVGIDSKVPSIMRDSNVLIGACTRDEYVIGGDLSARSGLSRYFTLLRANISSKTSDWIIQEIGLAIGLKLDVILLIEEGVRRPGGLQGDLEHIAFNRDHPERAFTKVLQMISHISPAPASSASVEVQSSPDTTKLQPESPPDLDWKAPMPGWDKRDYQNAFQLSLLYDDESTAASIDQAYLARENGSAGTIRVEWEAFCECTRLQSGKGGNLQKLKELAAAHPDNAALFDYLACGLYKFGQFAEAAQNFEWAARKENDSRRKIESFGDAAEALALAGATRAEVNRVLDEARSISQPKETDEKAILESLRSVAETSKDSQAEIASMQRIVEIDPSDFYVRYPLAFKHSETDNYELALYHYLQIPLDRRSPGIWNNIGVAYDKLKLTSKAVQAFQKAQDGGETLAMSNLAHKFLSARFLVEARSLIENALKLPKPHRNVAQALARADSQMEEEQKRVDDLFNKLRGENGFYNKFGRAMARHRAVSISERWRCAECTLTVRIDGSTSFTAIGQYEVGGLGLGIPMPRLSGAKREQWK